MKKWIDDNLLFNESKKRFDVMIQFLNYNGEVTEESLMASCPSENFAKKILLMLKKENDDKSVRYIIK